MFEIWFYDPLPCKVEVHAGIKAAQRVWDTLSVHYEMMNRRP